MIAAGSSLEVNRDRPANDANIIGIISFTDAVKYCEIRAAKRRILLVAAGRFGGLARWLGGGRRGLRQPLQSLLETDARKF